MTYDHAKVDLSLVPDGALKNTFIHFAEQHNALVDGANEIKQDLDQLTGFTIEEKSATYGLIGKLRRIWRALHAKRFNVALLMFQSYLLLGILKAVGITPVQFRQAFDLALKLAEKFATGN
jgi:hypothetical protein